VEGLSELHERNLECSGQIVLWCGCGENLILLGLEEDWRSELAPLSFECHCGQGLTLDAAEAGPSEEVLEIVKLLRSSTRPPGS
jgi:hypothetical protein